MPSFGQALRQSRDAAGLSLQEFARLSGLSAESLSAWEAGEPAPPGDMDRCALVMGVRLGDFLKGEGARTDVAMLFKKTGGQGAGAGREQLLALDASLGLSRFCRIAHELRDLRQLLGKPAPALPDLTKPYAARPKGESAGDHLALAARRALKLDVNEPIQSMRDLLQRVGVPLVVAGKGEVDPHVTGGSVIHPLPAVLLVPVWSSPWATRMTLAHELCHLLFHQADGFSVSGDAEVEHRSWNLDADYGQREQEANAFAAAFLAPRFAVQQLLQHVRPDSEPGVRKVGAHFKVGKRVAVNRIADIFDLTESRRQVLLASHPRWPPSDEDSVGDEDMGLLQGELQRLAFEALAQGLISKTRLRSILGVPDAEPLEDEALSEELKAPVLTREHQIARRCQAELIRQGFEVIAEDAEATEDGFQVRLTDLQGRPTGRVPVDREGRPQSKPIFE